jgi:hypothetical protein
MLRTKQATVMLVQIHADLLAEAVDYLSMSKAPFVTFQVMDGTAGRIDTEQQPTRLPLPALTHTPTPAPAAKRGIHVVSKKTVTLKNLTPKFVLASFTPTEQLSAKEFGDKLGVKRDDTSLRGKISRLLTDLRRDGKLAVTANRQGKYSLGGAAVDQTDVIASLDDITQERVLAVLSEHGPLPTKIVSDKLGIVARDGSKRSKVTKRIRELLNDQKIIVDPTQSTGTPLFQKVYKVASG